jgi:hypothetical protein
MRIKRTEPVETRSFTHLTLPAAVPQKQYHVAEDLQRKDLVGYHIHGKRPRGLLEVGSLMM